jgi:SIR2-like domain
MEAWEMPHGLTRQEDVEAHFRIVCRRLREGKVVPFLGAGANLFGRPKNVDWRSGRYLPSGQELAAYLAEGYAYPPSEAQDLLRVSQYVQAVTGGTALYDELHDLFARDYEPNSLHQLLATLSAESGDQGKNGDAARHLLIVTTNYDDALEQAFRAAGEAFDLVSYVAKGPSRGKFMHRGPDAEPHVIEEPNTYRGLSFDKRTVILKIHGAVVREDRGEDSYVITEDNYIEYLAQADVSNIIPATLMAAMNESHFLFLGYSLKDWNLRVILHRIWGQRPFEDQFTSWAIQKDPSRLEERLWRKRNVEILNVDLESYADGLRRFCSVQRDGQ